MKYRLKENPVVEAITFDELMAYGEENPQVIEDNVVTRFEWKGQTLFADADMEWSVMMVGYIHAGDVLFVHGDKASIWNGLVFNTLYEPYVDPLDVSGCNNDNLEGMWVPNKE